MVRAIQDVRRRLHRIIELRLIELRRIGVRDDSGAATAEYAITIMAAVGFAGLLVLILRSGEVQAILTDLVHNALSFGG
jgi:hypothetical protein